MVIFAQEAKYHQPLRIGLCFSPEIQYVTGGYNKIYLISPKTGITVGINGEITISKRFSMRTGLFYRQKRITYTEPGGGGFWDEQTGNRVYVDMDIDYSFDEWLVPILLKHNFHSKKNAFFISFGGGVGLRRFTYHQTRIWYPRRLGGVFVDLDDPKPHGLWSSGSLALIASFGYEYSFSRTSLLLIEPMIKIHLIEGVPYDPAFDYSYTWGLNITYNVVLDRN